MYLAGAVEDLNAWLNADNAKRRKLIRTINVWTYGVGVLTVLIALPLIDTAADPWVSSVLGAIIGLAIAAITTGSAYYLEQNARRKSARAAKEREDAAAAVRIEALRSGEPLRNTH